jgi:hypothetical protein
MKKFLGLFVATAALSLGFAGVASANGLTDLTSGSPSDFATECEELGGLWSTDGGNEPTCVVSDGDAEVKEAGQGVIITTGGGETTYLLEDAELDGGKGGAVLSGTGWDVETIGGGFCIEFQKGKNAGTTVCPPGKNK